MNEVAALQRSDVVQASSEPEVARSVRFAAADPHQPVAKTGDAPDISDALAVLQRSDVVQAMSVMQRYFDTVGKQSLPQPEQVSATNAKERDTTLPVHRPSGDKALIKPAVTNNLAVITVIWTIGGCFLLFGACKAKLTNTDGGVGVFALYGIVQSCLIVFILLVTGVCVVVVGGGFRICTRARPHQRLFLIPSTPSPSCQ